MLIIFKNFFSWFSFSVLFTTIFYSNISLANSSSVSELCTTLNNYSSAHSNQNVLSRYVGCWKAESQRYATDNNDSDFNINNYIKLPDYFSHVGNNNHQLIFPISAFIVFDPGESKINTFKITICLTNMGTPINNLLNLSTNISDYIDTTTGKPINSIFNLIPYNDSSKDTLISNNLLDIYTSSWTFTFLRDNGKSGFVTDKLVNTFKCNSPLS